MCDIYKRLVREPLPVGLIALLGRQGAGKTSLATALMSNDFKYYGQQRYDECASYVNMLNRNGFNLHLPKNKVLYFCPEDTYLDYKKGIKTWWCDAEKLALPNLDYEVQYFPRGSVIFLPEFDNLVNCRDWDSLSPYLVALAKYARHWKLTIIIDFQVWMQLDVALRRLMMYVIFIYDSYWRIGHRNYEEKHYIKKTFRKTKRVWETVFIDNQLNNFAKDLSSCVVDNKLVKQLFKQSVENKKFAFFGNIFTHYKSTSAEPMFLYKIKDYKYIPHISSNIYTPDGVDTYVETHPVVRSKETKKKK